MTRTALSPRLSAHLAEPFLDLHPTDAEALGIAAADLVRVKSPNGTGILRARITDSVQAGQVFAPMHWTGETAPSARIDALVAAVTDPVSGQPESKASVVAVERFNADWYGFAVSVGPMALSGDYWALAKTEAGYRAELAGTGEIADWEAEARRMFGAEDAQAAMIQDEGRGITRVALTRDDVLIGALFVAREPVAVMRDYLTTLPGTEAPQVLGGRRPAGQLDPGPVLCSCFGVGVNTIVRAIETQGLMSVDAVGDALQAGTNCGSCRPEIAALLAVTGTREAAE
jgi:assimilatory nitrate reductase catalytic subunit